MKMIVIIAGLMAMLVVPASAMRDKGYLANVLSVSTTDPRRITTPNGSDIQRMDVAYTPSVFYGFETETYIHVKGSDEAEVKKVKSELLGYNINNLFTCTYTSDDKIVGTDFLLDLDKASVTGNEGVSNTDSSTSNHSYEYSNRRGSNRSSEGSSVASSYSVDSVAVEVGYDYSLQQMGSRGTLVDVHLDDLSLYKSDSAVINRRSSEQTSFNRDDYGSNSRHGQRVSSGSSVSSSSSSTSTMYKSSNLEEFRMKRGISKVSIPNVAAGVIDGLANAGEGQVRGRVFKAPQSSSQNIPVTLQP